MKKLLVCIVVILLVLGCMQQNDPIQEEQSIAFQFMKPANIDVVSAKCRVSADDMDTILTYLSVSPTMISGEVPGVPLGENRLFEIMCYNSSGDMNYYGFALADISSLSPTVNISLNQVDSAADVSIIGTFGDTGETEEKIVFSANYRGNYDIYIMDTDGSNVERLTSTSVNEYCPRLSPDRKKVVYQRSTDAFWGDECCILDLETKEVVIPEMLSNINTHYIQWHPGGNKIIFRTNIRNVPDIYEYDLTEKTLRPLIQNNRRDWTASYSADGLSILYCSEINGKFRMCIANTNGTDSRIVNLGYDTEERRPAMNPVNSNLVVYAGRYFDQSSSTQFGLYMTNLSDSSISLVISTGGIDEKGPQWSPDGSVIYYAENNNSNYGIYKINPDGSGKTLILDSDGNERYPHCR